MRRLSEPPFVSRLSRRRGLQVGAAIAAGAALTGYLPRAAAGAEVDLKMLPLIDAHSHLWSPDVQRWPLANKQTKADLCRPSFTPEELWKVAEPEKVGLRGPHPAPPLSRLGQPLSDRLRQTVSGPVRGHGHDR